MLPLLGKLVVMLPPKVSTLVAQKSVRILKPELKLSETPHNTIILQHKVPKGTPEGMTLTRSKTPSGPKMWKRLHCLFKYRTWEAAHYI